MHLGHVLQVLMPQYISFYIVIVLICVLQALCISYCQLTLMSDYVCIYVRFFEAKYLEN